MKKIIAATYAPMHEDKNLNLEIVKDYAKFLKENKVMGAFVNGSTGDFVSLSTLERKRLIEAWGKSKPEGFYLINHVGHTNLRESKELAEHSSDIVDAIAALPPFYFRPKRMDDLLVYCSEVAQSAPNLPFYYYHIPVLTGVDFLMADFLDRATEMIPNFSGIKYTNDHIQDFGKCLEFAPERISLFFGIDEKFMDSLMTGATGWVGSTYNHLAPLYIKIASCVSHGEMEEAKLLQKKAITFVETLESLGGFHGGSKSFMKQFGLDMGPSRFPHKAFDDDKLLKARRFFEEMEIYGYMSKPFHDDKAQQ
ncbi:dihydrodipicolinate synthase family protein [Flagellimonas olearia]|uniref:N-acetylneuraminate lyase n=1 Tax=Flagellimonas olearia TaxID=552546 RepID=A0A444VM31_9FLAO|nr:dihydrodipicolinate synthase family protein [Allomuricauda olearia]RYC51760.1 N-acetylneuraminate lyase [Allomuricauda olearia]